MKYAYFDGQRGHLLKVDEAGVREFLTFPAFVNGPIHIETDGAPALTRGGGFTGAPIRWASDRDKFGEMFAHDTEAVLLTRRVQYDLIKAAQAALDALRGIE